MKRAYQSEMFTGVIVSSVISFASYVYTLFGDTIPSFFAVYFKEIGAALIMMAVFVFAIAWLLKAKPHKRPQKYLVKVFDVCGVETRIDGIRSEFKTHDVAWSFMKEYKKFYPLYNFALVSDLPNSERLTIYRYL
ncbi:MAG: hypothetical protein KGH76_03115 [Thaumarchaeota archaeon]|nr:hypothetical protein [Nitrososphaerota archaeon]MDE1842389.1 hypothetical protein [Nitrososphaerota archaeon]